MLRKNTKSKETSGKELVYIRELSDDEVVTLNDANKFLNELTDNSPYKSFQDKCDELYAIFTQLNEIANSGKVNAEKLRAVFSKLDDLLSSFKGFEDRTKSNIKNRYGEGSDVMGKFKEALSYEFDNMFEYRFSYNLRNYSQHKGSQVGEIKTSSKLVNGKPEGSATVLLDSRKLLESYSKWHSLVKKDLEEMNSTFNLIDVLDKLKFSCSRIYSKYLIAQESNILDSMTEMRRVVGDYDAKNETPYIIRLHKDFSKAGGTMSLTPIKVNLIETMEEILPSARKYAGLK